MTYTYQAVRQQTTTPHWTGCAAGLQPIQEKSLGSAGLALTASTLVADRRVPGLSLPRSPPVRGIGAFNHIYT